MSKKNFLDYNDHRSELRDRKKRNNSKQSSFNPIFNSDEFYNPVYKESVTSIDQQLEIVLNGNSQNATHALNSLSFILSNPFQFLSSVDTVNIGICGSLLHYSFRCLEILFKNNNWHIEYFSTKNVTKYTHIIIGNRPTEKDLRIVSELNISMTVEYHCKRYFDRSKAKAPFIDINDYSIFINETVLDYKIDNVDNVINVCSVLFALELFGSSKKVRSTAREFLKECLDDDQKDLMRLHWCKQPSKYAYNPKFFSDLTAFLDSIHLNGVLFQETAYSLTTIPSTQELLSSSSAGTVVKSMVIEKFIPEVNSTLRGITFENLDSFVFSLDHLNSIIELAYLSIEYCEVSSLTGSILPSISYISLNHITISENDFCLLFNSLPNLKYIQLDSVHIVLSPNSQIVFLQFPKCISFSIATLTYEKKPDIYKKISNIETLKTVVIEDFSLNATLFSINFSKLLHLQSLSILGIKLNEISELKLNSQELISLTIRSTGITTLTGLEQFKTLQTIQISNENLKDVASIVHCKNLYSISFRSCELKTFPIEVLDCKNVEDIDLTSNSIEQIEIQGKRGLQLKRLLCSNNQIHTFDVKNIPSLEFIYLSKNLLTTLPNWIQNPKNKQVTFDIFENPLVEKELEIALSLIDNGWKIICSTISNEDLKRSFCSDIHHL